MTIPINVTIEASLSTEIEVSERSCARKEFLNSNLYAHIKKLINSAGLCIDDVTVIEE